jgi:hypothetical protein
MVNAIIAHTTTDANTAAYCDAFASGYAEAQMAAKLAQAYGLLNEAMKGKKYAVEHGPYIRKTPKRGCRGIVS